MERDPAVTVLKTVLETLEPAATARWEAAARHPLFLAALGGWLRGALLAVRWVSPWPAVAGGGVGEAEARLGSRLRRLQGEVAWLDRRVSRLEGRGPVP